MKQTHIILVHIYIYIFELSYLFNNINSNFFFFFFEVSIRCATYIMVFNYQEQCLVCHFEALKNFNKPMLSNKIL